MVFVLKEKDILSSFDKFCSTQWFKKLGKICKKEVSGLNICEKALYLLRFIISTFEKNATILSELKNFILPELSGTLE